MKRRKLLKFLPLALLPPSWSRGATFGRDGRSCVTTGKSGKVRAWIVEEFIRHGSHTTWGFDGIFDNEKKAAEACVEENQSVRSVILNKEFSEENSNGLSAPGLGKFDTWIVGEMIPEDRNGKFTGSFVGVYDSEEAATKACASKHGFVAPAVLNETHAGDDVMRTWPGVWYPLWQQSPHLIDRRPGFIAALDFVESNDGKITPESFIRSHPAGQQLWKDSKAIGLIGSNSQGKIIILPKGQKLHEWLYWNSPLKSVRA